MWAEGGGCGERVRLEVWARTIWWDWRLEYNRAASRPAGCTYNFAAKVSVDEIWTPSVYIANLARPDKYRIWPLAETRWPSMVDAQDLWDIKCDMNFEHMPFDSHRCIMRIFVPRGRR